VLVGETELLGFQEHGVRQAIDGLDRLAKAALEVADVAELGQKPLIDTS
jgi:hypothetical protein